MSVNSPLELFLLLYGWQQYANFWSLLADTGIAFVPVGWIVVQGILNSAQYHRGASAIAAGSRLPVVVPGTLALFVLSFAATPYLSLSPTVLQHQPPCEESPPVSPGATSTLYDGALGDIVQETRVPAYWGLIMAISAGFNRAAITAIGCPDQLAPAKLVLDQTLVHDDDLLRKIGLFQESCYLPARAQYYREKPALGIVMNQGLDWIGSKIYRDTRGYYDSLDARDFVKGWPVDLSQETDRYYRDVVGENPPWGIPRCKDWWEEAERGLRRKLLNQYQPSVLDTVMNVVSPQSPEEREDAILRKLIQTVRASFPVASNFSGPAFNDSPFSLSRLFAVLGLKKEQLSFYPQMEAIKAALPIAKPFILMGIIMLLPFFLLASGYRLETLAIATIGYVGLNFLSVLWHIAEVLEERLIKGMWSDPMDYLSVSVPQVLSGRGLELELKLEVLEMVLPLLYLVLPLLFAIVITWAGVKAFVAVSGVTQGLTTAVGRAGRDAADTAQSMGINRLGRRR